MKINLIPTLIAISISALIAYGFFSLNSGENKLLLSFGSFFILSVTLILTIGAQFELPRTTTNARVLASIFFTIGLIVNFLFAFTDFTVPLFVITNGILILLLLLITYSLQKAKQ